MLNRDVGDDPPSNGKVSEGLHGSYAVHEEAERQRALERAAEEAAARRKALLAEAEARLKAAPAARPDPAEAERARREEEARWARARATDAAMLDAATRKIAATGGGLAPFDRVPPTTQGYAIPTAANVAEHAKPEMPGRSWLPDTDPDVPAPEPAPLDHLRQTLRACRTLDQAAEHVRRFAKLEPGRPPAELIGRLDSAERVWRFHHDAALRECAMAVRREAIAALRSAGLPEIAAAIEAGDWTLILEPTA